MKVLHITAHLGGGIGKALSSLVVEASKTHRNPQHSILCLEHPDKTHFLHRIVAAGTDVHVCPNASSVSQLIRSADIVQLEWWNHPTTIQFLVNFPAEPIRLLIWCHVSGLHTPVIPHGLIRTADRFVFTSPCSLKTPSFSQIHRSLRDRIGVVSSGGGLGDLPMAPSRPSDSLKVGYVGSLNFAKLHPLFVDFLSAVHLPQFTVKVIGDATERATLLRQCVDRGRPHLLQFTGYKTNVAAELASMHVLAYLLNPLHYGTAENALLEAMAMGVVPVVLDNLCELEIVRDRFNGLVVKTPADFAAAIDDLAKRPAWREQLAVNASRSVREYYTDDRMAASLYAHYEAVTTIPKHRVEFRTTFGSTPADWFLACQADHEVFGEDGTIHYLPDDLAAYMLFERSKGSVFHFQRYFPDDAKLRGWSKQLATHASANLRRGI